METETEQNNFEQKKKEKVNWLQENKKILISVIGLFFLGVCVISTFSIFKLENNKKADLPTEEKTPSPQQKKETKAKSETTGSRANLSSQVKPFPFSETKNILVTVEDKENSVVICAININNEERVEFLEIVKPAIDNNYQIEKDRPVIQIANNGALAYTLYNKSLYFYDKNTVTESYVSRDEFDFALSPDGGVVIIVKKEPKEDINIVGQRFSETNNWEYITQHYFYKIDLKDTQTIEFLLQKDLMANTFDSKTYFKFVDWCQVQTANPWLQSWSLGQLSHTPSGLYELRVEENDIVGAFSSIDQMTLKNKRFLNVNADNRYLAYSNIDEACCGGINYSNNQTYILDLAKKEEKKIFDEYNRYRNSTKSHTEQHETKSLSFSPDNSLVAQTIYNLYRIEVGDGGREDIFSTSASLLVTDVNGNEKKLFDNYTLIGWLDNEVIVAAKTVKSSLSSYNDDWWENKYNSIDLINIITGEIEKVYSSSFNDVEILR